MRRPLRRTRADPRLLAGSQRDELASGWAVASGRPSAFESEEQAAEAWRLHGERIRPTWECPWRRPRGFWLYDRGEAVPDTGADELVRSWRLVS